MNKLVINTANDKLIVVLQSGNNVFYKINDSKMHHNETMLPLIEELLKENGINIKDITEFGVVIGPGSFTGIRVGVSMIKAFRDSLNVTAKGVNNLDYLYALAKKQYPEIDTVAICGSKDSYFVAKNIHNQVYKYGRNLTTEELENIAEGKPVGVIKDDINLNYKLLVDDAQVLLDCLEQSQDYDLMPVYYQLSQAENEKLKRGKIEICQADVNDENDILQIEQDGILTNALTASDIKTSLNDRNYIVFKSLFNGQIVGFVIGQITDEINIVSIAVKKDFRNLGIATRLIGELQEYAKQIMVNRLSLEVSYNNITAYLLYKKLGFIKRRIRTKYYSDGSDCVEMVKNIF